MGHIKISSPDELNEAMNDLYGRLDTLEKCSGEERQNGTQIENLKASIRGLRALQNGEFDNETSTDKDLKRSGSFMKTVAKRGDGNVLSDEEIELIKNSKPRRFVKAALGTPLTDDATTGSYAVPTEFHREVLRVVEESSELFGKTRTVNMNSRQKNYAKKNAGLAFTYLSSDGDDISEDNPTFAQGTLTAYTYAAYLPVTEAFLEDEDVEVAEYFRNIIAEAYSDKYDAEFLTGSGAPTTGVLNDTSCNTVTMGAGDTSFSSLDVDDFVALEAELSETKGALRNAAFIMSPYMWNKCRGLKNADGDALIAPWANSLQRSLLGYPVLLSYQMPDSDDDAADTAVIAFGNPKHLVYGDRIGLEVKFFPETRYAVTNAEAFFRFRFRAGFSLAQPGYFAVLKTAAA